LLKDDPATRDIYIIILSAKGQDRDKQIGQEVGADGYFVKPFSPLELLGQVEKVLS